jgi:hypothetical protein
LKYIEILQLWFSQSRDLATPAVQPGAVYVQGNVIWFEVRQQLIISRAAKLYFNIDFKLEGV